MFSEELRLGSPGLANKVTLTIAEMGAYSRKTAVQAGFDRAMSLAYIPSLFAAIGPDGRGFTEGNVPAIPALRYFFAAAKEERLLQVADYCAWAIQRNLRNGDDRGYAEIRRFIRSERFITIRKRQEPLPEGMIVEDIISSPHVAEYVRDYEVTSVYRVGPGDSYQALLAVEECVRDGDYYRSVDYLELISPAILNEGRLSEFFYAVLATVTYVVMDRPEIAFRAAGIQERWARYSLRIHPDDRDLPVLLAESAYNRAILLERAGDLPGSIDLYDTIVRDFEGVRDSLVGTVVAKALVNKGNNLRRLGDWKAGFKCHEKAISLYGTEVAPWFDEPLEKAFWIATEEYRSRRRYISLAVMGWLVARRRFIRWKQLRFARRRGGG